MSDPAEGKLVVWLDDVRDDDVHRIGPKAANLARMLRAQLPVPPGFCLTAEAYGQHLQVNGLNSRIRAAIEEPAGDTGCQPRALAHLRQAITEAPMHSKLPELMERAWTGLAPDAVAVRSSATAEDLPGHSFAGQYDSFLGATGLADLLDRIRQCWASLWSQRAFHYRQTHRLDHAHAAMGVIVQRLVPAGASGVMFTADPATGRRDCVVIESAWGLGEAVVQGKVTPDRIVVSKRIFRIERRQTLGKHIEIVPADGAVHEQPVAPGRAERPSLCDSTACWLALHGTKIEDLFGSPQDIEWAVVDRQIHVLQARPITALPPEPRRSWEDRQIWTNTNVREAAPDPLTPMAWSLLLQPVALLFGPSLERAGIDVDPRRLFGLVGGRVYFNVNLLVAIGRTFPTWGEFDPGTLFGGGGHSDDAPAEGRLPPEDLPPIRVHWLRRITGMTSLVWWFLTHPMHGGPRLLAEAQARIDAMEETTWTTLGERELVRRLQVCLDAFGEEFLWDGGPVLFSGMGCCLALMGLCRRWFGEEGGEIANRLLSGMGGLADAQAGIDLWRLAAEAHKHPPVAEAVRQQERFDAVRRRVEGAPGGGEFLTAWQAFMRQHGHHGRCEIEIGVPRWAERPDYVLGLVRSCLAGMGRVDPVVQARRLGRQRARLARQCRRRLRNPLKRLIFDALLRLAQQGLRFRETSKSIAVRWLAALRPPLLEAGDRLVRRGAVADADDVFFLALGELGPALSERLGARDVVAQRRAEYSRNAAVTPPAIVFGRFDPDDVADEVIDRRDVLRGMAVCPGVVTGKARVLLHSQDADVLPGEVLVAPITDPGWTPYFVNAAAIVIDQGGLLSHGSIIAREYGIPCVVNVGPATEIIRTGQLIRVDGTQGTVAVLSDDLEPPQAAPG